MGPLFQVLFSCRLLVVAVVVNRASIFFPNKVWIEVETWNLAGEECSRRVEGVQPVRIAGPPNVLAPGVVSTWIRVGLAADAVS